MPTRTERVTRPFHDVCRVDVSFVLLLSQDQFVTAGDDGSVRVWSNGKRKALRTLNVG